MNYTIAMLESLNGLKLNVDKNGNQYTVGLFDSETKNYTHKSFVSLDEAFKVFQKVSEYIIKGLGSYNDKCNLLLGK